MSLFLMFCRPLGERKSLVPCKSLKSIYPNDRLVRKIRQMNGDVKRHSMKRIQKPKNLETLTGGVHVSSARFQSDGSTA